MFNSVFELIEYYWPRILFGVAFALANTAISLKGKSKKRFIPRFLILFVMSCTTVQIVNEMLSDRIYGNLIRPLFLDYNESIQIGVKISYRMFTDTVACIIPIFIFARIINEKVSIAASLYFVYVLCDRLAMVMAVSPISYFVLQILINGITLFAMRKDTAYVMEHPDGIDWRPVVNYQLASFFLINALYDVYYIFPGIVNGEMDIKNIWIDTIAVFSFIFYIGFVKLNLKVAKEHAQKMKYMLELQENERDIIQKFAEISEAKSGETGQHVRRVAEYSALLARECGYGCGEVERIRIASMMHDVGKLLVPIEIIEKPGELTEEEMEIMKKHTTYAEDILANSKGEVISIARKIAYQHHEWWDGSGYPTGAKGHEISMHAQIVAVADVYDALTSKRAYKEAWSSEKARREILSQREIQFSPRVVDVFEKNFDKILEIQNTYQD